MFAWFLEHIVWILFWTVSIMGAILIYLTPWKILSFVISATIGIMFKLTERNFSRQLMYSKTLPDENRPESFQAFLDGSANRRERIETYLNVFEGRTENMNGKYSVQLYIEGLRDPNLDQSHRALREDLKEFDRREEELRKEIYAMEAELLQLRRAEQLKVSPMEKSLTKLHTLWLQKHADAKARGTFSGIRALLRDKELRRARKRWKSILRVIARNTKVYKAKVEVIEAKYLPRIVPRLALPHDFEMAHLHKRVHLFEADWASFKQTVITGRTLELLCFEQSDAMKELRSKLKLVDIPEDIDKWKETMFDALKGKVALHPRISTPELGEIWFRQHFIKLGPDGCPEDERIGSAGFHLWVLQLAAPAALDA